MGKYREKYMRNFYKKIEGTAAISKINELKLSPQEKDKVVDFLRKNELNIRENVMFAIDIILGLRKYETPNKKDDDKKMFFNKNYYRRRF